MRPSANSIVEAPSHRQLRWNRASPFCFAMVKTSAAILPRLGCIDQWRSSLPPDDKCHPGSDINS
jgi:hypothetical protein